MITINIGIKYLGFFSPTFSVWKQKQKIPKLKTKFCGIGWHAAAEVVHFHVHISVFLCQILIFSCDQLMIYYLKLFVFCPTFSVANSWGPARVSKPYPVKDIRWKNSYFPWLFTFLECRAGFALWFFLS